MDEKNEQWEQLAMNENRVLILLTLRDRAVASKAQIQHILIKYGVKGRKPGKVIAYQTISEHINLLMGAGLIKKSLYPSPHDVTKPAQAEGLKLTAEGREFLEWLMRGTNEKRV